MKAVILAGGLGTRLAEETDVRPKPMVEIGGMPILWHILKIYSHYGIKEFYIALGYKGEYVKRWFMDYSSLGGDMTVATAQGEVRRRGPKCEDWVVHLVDTGNRSNTGGRLLRLKKELSDGEFLVTYGDGVSNVNIEELIAFHRSQRKVATVTAVRPPARYGGIIFDGDLVGAFTEKPQAGEGWINGGFFVFDPAIFEYLEGDSTILETDVLETLARSRELAAYRHADYWQCMDTLRDKQLLENAWTSGKAPWRIWQ